MVGGPRSAGLGRRTSAGLSRPPADRHEHLPPDQPTERPDDRPVAPESTAGLLVGGFTQGRRRQSRPAAGEGVEGEVHAELEPPGLLVGAEFVERGDGWAHLGDRLPRTGDPPPGHVVRLLRADHHDGAAVEDPAALAPTGESEAARHEEHPRPSQVGPPGRVERVPDGFRGGIDDEGVLLDELGVGKGLSEGFDHRRILRENEYIF